MTEQWTHIPVPGVGVAAHLGRCSPQVDVLASTGETTKRVEGTGKGEGRRRRQCAPPGGSSTVGGKKEQAPAGATIFFAAEGILPKGQLRCPVWIRPDSTGA